MASWQHLEVSVRADETYAISVFGCAMPHLEPDLRWYEVIADLGSQGWELVHVGPTPATRHFWFKRPSRV